MRQENIRKGGGPRGRKARLAAGLASTGMAAVLLAGCSSLPDAANPVSWFDDRPQVERRPSDDAPYPNLASVPERPTDITTAEQRRQLRQGLLADRERARYTDEQPANAVQPGVAEPSAPRPSRAAAPAGATPPAVPPLAAPPTPSPAPMAAPAETPSVAAPVGMSANSPPADPPLARDVPQPPAPSAPAVRPQEPFTSERSSGQVATTSRESAVPGRSSAEQNEPPAALPAPEPRPAAPRAEIQAPAPPPPPAQPSAPASAMPAMPAPAAVAAPRAPEPVAESRPAPSPSPAPISLQSQAQTVEQIYREQFARSAPPPAASPMPAQAPSASLPGSTGAVSSQAGAIFFAHNSASLSAEDRRILRAIALRYRETGGTLRIVGHASSDRSADVRPVEHALANLEVSAKRAEAVAQELQNAGVPSTAMLVRGVGDNQPVYRQANIDPEAAQRRVEIFFDY
ncbi:OmpA family protein [Oceanibaculum pacificum]|uniref:OmpA-like domain-containing protein n=1 Tax=Oceanibaculum pacificum TaxID=580166 RepID=A0A154VWY2_9PROT|nr:OmpA family protein [Oceanibaculum pacificum]KZD05816.1 hypothetical protein AUP43_02570 [Oceanibaculum pacificum]